MNHTHARCAWRFGCILFSLCGFGLFAQVDTGTIRGTVTDVSSKVVTGAKVTITQEETGLTLTTQSGPDGSYVFGSSGESVGNLRVSGLGLNEEAVELATGGVERALLVFPAVVDQRATVLVDHIADELFRRKLSQRRVIVHLPDDLSAK